MAKESKALTKPGNVFAMVDDQVTTLEKVLAPNEKWLTVKTLAPAKIAEASSAIVAIREIVDTAEKGRKLLTAPLLAQKREIDEAYKAFMVRAERVDQHVARLLVVVQAQERARLQKEAEKDAKKLEKAGATQAAEDVRAGAASAPVIGGSGITTFTTVTAKVVDLKALCREIAEGRASPDLVEPAQSKLNALARSGSPLPEGVERVETTDVKRTAQP